MLRSGKTLAVILALAAILMPLRGYAQNRDQSRTDGQPPLVLKSVSIDLPAGDRMFAAGPDSDAINGNCVTCHSAGMVLNQPALSKEAWAAEVHKMITVYKAPVAAENVPAIVAYLDRLNGAEHGDNKPKPH